MLSFVIAAAKLTGGRTRGTCGLTNGCVRRGESGGSFEKVPDVGEADVEDMTE